MKQTLKTLFVIEKAPDSDSNGNIIDLIKDKLKADNQVTIYIHHEGVRWLFNENWIRIQYPENEIVYYANANDAHQFGVPFQQGVILSNPKIMHQLLNWADSVYYLC